MEMVLNILLRFHSAIVRFFDNIFVFVSPASFTP